MDLALELHQREAFSLDLHTNGAAFGILRLLRNFDESGHGRLLCREFSPYL
jgi:hypothetical protein